MFPLVQLIYLNTDRREAGPLLSEYILLHVLDICDYI